MKYAWQHPDWPNFTYESSELNNSLYDYSRSAGRIAGGVERLKEKDKSLAYVDLMVSEAISSSQIEGEKLNRDDVRSSIKNFLGLSTVKTRVADPRAEGIGALMVETHRNFKLDLSEKRLGFGTNLCSQALKTRFYPTRLK